MNKGRYLDPEVFLFGIPLLHFFLFFFFSQCLFSWVFSLLDT